MPQKIIALLSVCCLLACTASNQQTRVRHPITPKLIAETDLRAHTGASLFNGISGIDYDPIQQRFYAISDDRAHRGPAQFFQFHLSEDYVAKNILIRELKGSDGAPFSKNEVDAESIRYHPKGKILWSSELGKGGPAVYFTQLGTNKTVQLNLPQYVTGYDGTSDIGYRSNKFIEGAAFSPNFHLLFLSLEAPLLQDGNPPDLSSGALTRILMFDTNSSEQLGEYAYPLDPIPRAASAVPAWQDNGISEILALDKSTLLVLERSGRHIGDGLFDFDIRIYLVDLDDASNIQGLMSVRDLEDITTANKRLLISLNHLAIKQHNFEGMTFGPLINGMPTLWLISDNNFVAGEPARLLVFTLQ